MDIKKYKHLADLMALLHFVWIAMAIASLPLAIAYPSYKSFTLWFVVITVASWAIWRGCVLHIYENLYRNKHNPLTAHGGTFIGAYLKKLFGIEISDWTVRTIIYLYLAILFLVAIQ